MNMFIEKQNTEGTLKCVLRLWVILFSYSVFPTEYMQLLEKLKSTVKGIGKNKAKKKSHDNGIKPKAKHT